MQSYRLKNTGFGDFPGGLVVKNLPPNAENEVPGWRTKILHPAGLLSPRGNYFACAIKPRTNQKKEKSMGFGIRCLALNLSLAI